MKSTKTLLSAVFVSGLVACAKLPQADIDAAKGAVATAKTADVAVYAPDTLRAADGKLAALQAEIDSQARKNVITRSYDAAKSLAAETVAAAQKAVADAARNKEAVKNEATQILANLVASIPEAERKLIQAQRVRNIKLDFKALKTKLEDAKTVVSDAQKDFEAGKFADAKARSLAVQSELAAMDKAVNEAVQAATRKR